MREKTKLKERNNILVGHNLRGTFLPGMQQSPAMSFLFSFSDWIYKFVSKLIDQRKRVNRNNKNQKKNKKKKRGFSVK
jgi:hypothetical protein